MKHKILIVEDDPNLGIIVKESFETRGFEARLSENGKKGYTEYVRWKPDVCILDIMMPEKDGFTLAEEIRATDQHTPIIFLTARSFNEDVLKAFAIGADDYIKKPFSMEELIYRTKAILKRLSGIGLEFSKTFEYPLGKYHFDYRHLTLTYNNKQQKLTSREADLLKLLCDHKNQVLDRGETLKKLWGDDNFFTGRSLDVFITKIRKYLKEDDDVEIINVRGKGYKLIGDD